MSYPWLYFHNGPGRLQDELVLEAGFIEAAMKTVQGQESRFFFLVVANPRSGSLPLCKAWLCATATEKMS